MGLIENFLQNRARKSRRRSRHKLKATTRRAALGTRTEPDLSGLRQRVTLRVADEPDLEERLVALREAFTPTRPQRSYKRLAGRKPELTRIFHAITQQRAHVVLYGERGRGKTSLVNLVASSARSSGYMVARYSCTFDSDFEEIIRGLARDLPKPLLAAPVVQDPLLDGCESALPHSKVYPRDVAMLPGRLAGGHLLLIIDEFDRVTDDETRTRIADTIKQSSDRGTSLSFMLVGVSDSLEELLGRHPSIQRNIVGVPIPLLSQAEVEAIIDIGSQDARVEFPMEVRRLIMKIACGVPYIVQLLGLHAGERALRRGATTVDQQDILGAIQQSVLEIDPRVAVLYSALTKGGEDANLCHLLYAVATGKQDQFGRFLVQDMVTEMIVAGQRFSHQDWQRLTDAGVLRPCRGAGFGLYTFAEPMLPHYVLLRATGYGLPRIKRKETGVFT